MNRIIILLVFIIPSIIYGLDVRFKKFTVKKDRQGILMEEGVHACNVDTKILNPFKQENRDWRLVLPAHAPNGGHYGASSYSKLGLESGGYGTVKEFVVHKDDAGRLGMQMAKPTFNKFAVNTFDAWQTKDGLKVWIVNAKQPDTFSDNCIIGAWDGFSKADKNIANPVFFGSCNKGLILQPLQWHQDRQIFFKDARADKKDIETAKIQPTLQDAAQSYLAYKEGVVPDGYDGASDDKIADDFSGGNDVVKANAKFLFSKVQSGDVYYSVSYSFAFNGFVADVVNAAYEKLHTDDDIDKTIIHITRDAKLGPNGNGPNKLNMAASNTLVYKDFTTDQLQDNDINGKKIIWMTCQPGLESALFDRLLQKANLPVFAEGAGTINFLRIKKIAYITPLPDGNTPYINPVDNTKAAARTEWENAAKLIFASGPKGGPKITQDGNGLAAFIKKLKAQGANGALMAYVTSVGDEHLKPANDQVTFGLKAYAISDMIFSVCKTVCGDNRPKCANVQDPAKSMICRQMKDNWKTYGGEGKGWVSAKYKCKICSKLATNQAFITWIKTTGNC